MFYFVNLIFLEINSKLNLCGKKIIKYLHWIIDFKRVCGKVINKLIYLFS